MNQLPLPARPLYIQSFKTDDHINYIWKTIDALRRNVDSLAGRSIGGVNIIQQTITEEHVVAGSDVTAFHNSGDSFGVNARLGTNDAFDLEIERGGTLVADFSATRLKLASSYKLYLGATSDLQENVGSVLLAADLSNTLGVGTVIRNTGTGAGSYAFMNVASSENNVLTFRINNSTVGGAGLINTPGAGVLYMGFLTAGAAQNRPLIIGNSFGDANSPIIFGVADTEKMRMQASTGFIGLNTTTPRRRMDILDDTNPQLRLTQADNSKYVEVKCDANGYVYLSATGKRYGFQQSSPQATVHITQDTVGSEVFRIESTATNDDPSDRYSHYRAATTDATLTTVATVAIPASTTVHLEAKVRARRTGGASGTAEDAAAYVIHATYKNVAGTATLVGSVNSLHVAEDQVAWDCTFNISSGNVLLQVTGAAGNDVTWHATVVLSQVGS